MIKFQDHVAGSSGKRVGAYPRTRQTHHADAGYAQFLWERGIENLKRSLRRTWEDDMTNKPIPGPQDTNMGSAPEIADTFGGPETFEKQPPTLIDNPSSEELAKRSGQIKRSKSKNVGSVKTELQDGPIPIDSSVGNS